MRLRQSTKVLHHWLCATFYSEDTSGSCWVKELPEPFVYRKINFCFKNSFSILILNYHFRFLVAIKNCRKEDLLWKRLLSLPSPQKTETCHDVFSEHEVNTMLYFMLDKRMSQFSGERAIAKAISKVVFFSAVYFRHQKTKIMI